METAIKTIQGTAFFPEKNEIVFLNTFYNDYKVENKNQRNGLRIKIRDSIRGLSGPTQSCFYQKLKGDQPDPKMSPPAEQAKSGDFWRCDLFYETKLWMCVCQFCFARILVSALTFEFGFWAVQPICLLISRSFFSWTLSPSIAVIRTTFIEY